MLKNTMLNQHFHFHRMAATAALAVFFVFVGGSSALGQSSGAEVYNAKCKMCHGADLKGNTPGGKMTHAQPLDSPEVVKKSDADLMATTKNGKNKMPAFAAKLSDPQIKAVIAYIRTLQKK